MKPILGGVKTAFRCIHALNLVISFFCDTEFFPFFTKYAKLCNKVLHMKETVNEKFIGDA